ncbi:MAG: hypothetical protein KatS3mg021_2454 [Fimbriimonadales bacterium]|nr:MAG: hypothetical protein KatS3mg021_2454 [Fimbriimonadales bacterium]
MPEPEVTLASWTVVFRLAADCAQLGHGASGGDCGGASSRASRWRRSGRFTLWVALGTSGFLAAVVFTPTARAVSPIECWRWRPELKPVRYGILLCLLLPAFTAIGSTLRGVLILRKQTSVVYRGNGR